MKIAIGADHTAVGLKSLIIEHLQKHDFTVIDCGTDQLEDTDYPVYGKKVAALVASKKVDRGIVICGTGIGIANSANKIQTIRCAVASDPVHAYIARAKYNINVLAMGARVVGDHLALQIVATFLKTSYSQAEDCDRRIHFIDEMIKVENFKHLVD